MTTNSLKKIGTINTTKIDYEQKHSTQMKRMNTDILQR